VNIKYPLISAWVGQGNFGDELLSYGLRLELQNSADVSEFFYYESGGHPIYQAGIKDFSTALNYETLGRLQKIHRQYFQSLKKFNSIYFGGGSIFHSRNSISWKHHLLKRFRSTNPTAFTAAVGVSIGPFTDSCSERDALALLGDFDLVYCRDAPSADFARQVGNKVKVVQGRDLAFSVKALNPKLFFADKIKGRIGFSFILNPKLSRSQQDAHYYKMLSLIDFFSNSGYEVLLVSLYCGGKYSDHLVHQRLCVDSKNKNLVRAVHYDNNLNEIVSHISSCSFYISMRLHGAVTAFLSDVPFFALSSHPKVIEFCDSIVDMGWGCQRADLETDTATLLELITVALSYDLSKDKFYKSDHDELYVAGSSSLRGR
jgi:polysaccharide pyruvyl transferase WcaK-like protein